MGGSALSHIHREAGVRADSGGSGNVAIERDTATMRRARSDRVIQKAVGQTVMVLRRFDGKPEVTVDSLVSAAHCGDLTLAVAGRSTISCDMERVEARPISTWRDLIGPVRLQLAEAIAQETGEEIDATATRVWTTGECLKKIGASYDGPVVYTSCTSDGWVLISAGSLISATYVAPVRDIGANLALSVLVRRDDACL